LRAISGRCQTKVHISTQALEEIMYMFHPESCRFFLYDSFTEIINDQLQNLQFNPVNGARLSFQCSHPDCHQSVSVEIDSEGNLSKLSVIDPETNSADMIFDFGNGKFSNYQEQLDLICGHPIYHMLQQTTVAHYQAGHYAVIATAL
jgi:hypothetical protein